MPKAHLALAAATLLLAACSTDTTQPGTQTSLATSSVRVINASASQLTLIVDADTALRAVQVGAVSSAFAITPGAHQIKLAAGGTVSAPISITAVDGHELIAVGRGGASSAITSTMLADTGLVVPANKSKLRVVHMSANAGNIEIWRTQPDYQTPVHIMTPFAYGAESPYLQSDPGAWEVFITAGGSTTKLVTTGAVNISAGQRKTAVLLDSAGSTFFRVLDQ